MYSMTLSATSFLTSLRAVPDLTFSEVAFLNPYRPKQDTVGQPVPEKKRRRKDKSTDAEEEMSRFFRAKHTDQRGDVARRDQNSREPSLIHCTVKGFEGTGGATTAPLSPPVELPDLPFLGFGSSGMNTISPVKVTVSGDAPCGMVTPGRPRSSIGSSIGSSSYYTWTATPSSKANRRCRTDGTSGEVCRDSQKTQRAYSSSMTNCQSSLKESANDKALHIPNIDPEINHKSPENQALNLENAPRHKSHRTEEEKAEKAFCTGQRPRSGVATHVSSLEGREPADGEPDQTLREEADEEADNECQGATKLEAREKTGNCFPLCFDEALERLLEACNFPSNQSKNPINTPRMSKWNDQFQYRDGWASSFKPKNIGKLGRSLTPISQSINPCEEYSQRDLGPDSPSLTRANDTSCSTTTSFDNDSGNHSITFAHIGRGSELSANVPARSISRQEADVQMSMPRRGHQYSAQFLGNHCGDVWRGYQNIYQGQILPDVEAGSNTNGNSDVGSLFNQRGGTCPTYGNDSAEDVKLEDFQGIGAGNLSHSPQTLQDNPDSYDDATCDWQPNSYTRYDQSQYFRNIDNEDAANVVKDNIVTSAFSPAATKRTDIPSEPCDSPHARNMAISAVSTEHYGDHNTLDDHQRLDQYEPCDAHWAGFWRPNKLY